MLSETQEYIFQRSNKDYLKWLFPQNKSTLVNGLVFMFITITALSLVDYFYYSEAYYRDLKPAQSQPFKIDSIYRLILVPLLNIMMIFLAKSNWTNSMKRLDWIVGIVAFASIFGFLGSSFSHPYYSADDFTFDALVQILFIQTILGLTFRTSFLFNLILVTITVGYVWLDDLELKIQMYNTTLLILLWIPVLFGTFKLEQSRKLNFKTISKLKVSNGELANAHQDLAEQKKLLRAGERVSQLASWKTTDNMETVQYSDGIYKIYELDKTSTSPEDLYLTILRLTHPEDLEKVVLNIKELRNNRASQQAIEYRILVPGERIKWLRYTIGENRKETGIVGTVQDITKSKILELTLQKTANQLEVKNQDLQQFAYASSHDLQEPLRTITNFGNMLNRKIGDQLKGDERIYLDYILKSTTRMSDLIHAILEYSRIGRNKTMEEIDCNAILKNVLADLNFSIEKVNGIIKYHQLPEIIGYKVEFRMLLQNLIGNALKFRKKDNAPIISISCQTSGSYFIFSIRDNGIGMEAKHLSKIFQLFSRLHGKDAFEGTGIGLTHCKKITELHGGKIWVQSQKNEGSTFYFTISKALKINKNEKEITLHHAH